VCFLELRHVDGDQVAFTTVEQIREGKRGFGLPDPAGADQHKDADGLLGVVETSARGGDALADNLERMHLPDDSLAEKRRQRKNRRNFILHHFADGNSGPRGDDFADDLGVDGNANHRRLALQDREFGLSLREFGAQGGGINAGGASATAVAAAGEDALTASPAGVAGPAAAMPCEPEPFPPGAAVPACGVTEPSSCARRSRMRVTNVFSLSKRVRKLVKLVSISDFLPAIAARRSRWSEPTAASRSRIRCWTARSSICPHAVFNGRRRGALSESQPCARGIEHADGFIRKLASGEIAVR